MILLLVSSYSLFKEIRNYPVTAWLDDHRADCAIVLTGGPNRIFDAFEQLYLKRVKKVIISGVNPATELRYIFPQKAFYGKLDEGDIILEKRSLTTYGNAQQALPLVEALNCKDVVLITSKLHMTRAYKTFRNHFPKDIPIYKRSTMGKRYKPHWSRVGSETMKAVFYDLWLY
ncbi:MAG: YdcF family protein [Bdellovibrionales bacterium]|nr:YdcF family protein [Bdellovibrionales bacterium]